MFQPLLAVILLAISQLPGMTSSPAPVDINRFVRGVLEDRFLVEGYPEQGLFGDSKQIDIQREMGDTFFVLGPSALPRVPGFTFRLRDRADLERDAASSTGGVHFVKVNRPSFPVTRRRDPRSRDGLHSADGTPCNVLLQQGRRVPADRRSMAPPGLDWDVLLLTALSSCLSAV
jgi:hypothetical protein